MISFYFSKKFGNDSLKIDQVKESAVIQYMLSPLMNFDEN